MERGAQETNKDKKDTPTGNNDHDRRHTQDNTNNPMIEEYNYILQHNQPRNTNSSPTRNTIRRPTIISLNQQPSISSPPPPTDRSKLIGLAQLSTPNWYPSILQQQQQQQPTHNNHNHNDNHNLFTPQTAPLRSHSHTLSSHSPQWSLDSPLSPIQSHFSQQTLTSPLSTSLHPRQPNPQPIHLPSKHYSHSNRSQLSPTRRSIQEDQNSNWEKDLVKDYSHRPKSITSERSPHSLIPPHDPDHPQTKLAVALGSISSDHPLSSPAPSQCHSHQPPSHTHPLPLGHLGSTQNHPSSPSSASSSSPSSFHETRLPTRPSRKHSLLINPIESFKGSNSFRNGFLGSDAKNHPDPPSLDSSNRHHSRADDHNRTSLHDNHPPTSKPLPLDLVHPLHHPEPFHPPHAHPRPAGSTKSSPSTHQSTSSLHSPSTIAHSILRTASSYLDPKDLPEMDIEQVAAHNDPTAEALRKLDGLSNISASPRVARQIVKEQHTSTAHHSHRRPTSTGPRRRSVTSRSNSRPSSPSSASAKDRSGAKDRSKPDEITTLKKTRTRSVASTKDSLSNSSSLPEDAITPSDPPVSPAIQLSSTSKSTCTSAPTQPPHSVNQNTSKTWDASSPASSPRQVFHSISSAASRPTTHSKSATTAVESSDAMATSSSKTTVLTSANLPVHQTDCNRGCSSSTSYTAGTPTTVESRNSTLGTSASASSSFPTHHQSHALAPSRSSPTKGRNSVGSEGSSVLSSSGNGTEMGRYIERSTSNLAADGAEDRKIPPVPPLPKDYETFKPNPHSSPLHHRQPSHSHVQTTNSRTSTHHHLDSLQPTNTLPTDSTCQLEIDLSNRHPPLITPSLISPHAPQPHASVTARFLHSLTAQKTSDDLTSGSLTALQPAHLLAASATTHHAKPTKKWSLSAALGMNRAALSSKESSAPEDPALQSTLTPPYCHYQLSHPDFKDGPGPATQARRASWLSAHHPSSPNQSHFMSPHPPVSQSAPIESSSHPPNRVQPSRDRKESSSSILTTESLHSAVPATKSSIGSALSSRRTPSGIPFFSRKTSGNQSAASSDQSANMFTESTASLESATHGGVKAKSHPEKPETSELGGRRSMMSLNVFIRNSVHRRPTLSTSKLSPSFISHPTGLSESGHEPKPTSSSRHSLKSMPTKSPPATQSRHNHLPPSPHKISTNLTNNNGTSSELLDSHNPIEPSSSPRRTTLSLKASNLISRKRGKTVSLAGPSKEKLSLPPPLPPLQMSAIHASTTQRVASITSTANCFSSSNASKRRSIDYTTSSTFPSREPRVRTLKESTTSLRKALPTIDASPLRMAGELGEEEPKLVPHPAAKARQEVSTENMNTHLSNQKTSITPNPYQAQTNDSICLTPTKIPRAVFRSQKNSVSPLTKSEFSKTNPSSPRPNELHELISESQDHTDHFDNPTSHDFPFASNQAVNLRASDNSGSLIPRSRSGASSMSKKRLSHNDLKPESNPSPTHTLSVESEENTVDQKKTTAAAPQTSTVSVEKDSSAAARLAAARRTVAKSQEVQAARVASKRLSSHHGDQTVVSEFGTSLSTAISSSRSSRTIPSKLTIPCRMSRSSTTPSLVSATESIGLSSRSSSSVAGLKGRGLDSKENIGPVLSEEEIKGDEEMAQYATRQKTKKLMSGMTPAEVAKLFQFPKPIEPTKPMTTQEALRLYKSYLSEYEKGEILGYSEIYYVGSESLKTMAWENKPHQNYGYDDERGDYHINKNDHLIYRYEIIEVLGKGSFGQVLQCRDHKTGHMFAIKIIRNKRRFHHQALVEIRVLENLVNWDPEDKHCVLKMTDHFTFRGHLCIVNELLSINLYELIRNNSFNGFSTTLIRRFTMQILSSLSLLRHHRVVHCDLKPENILLKHPVILGMNYHMAIDMWSLGCIMAELYTGETESEQLACIMEVLGMPDKYLIDRSSRKKLFFDSTGAPRPVVNSKGRRRRVGSKTLQSVLKTDDELFIDFISKCLAWDPERRLKPDPAMRHPWILAGRSRANANPQIISHNNTSSNTAGTSTENSSLSHHSLGVGGRLANGRFNSGTSSLHISSPRRKPPQMGSSSKPLSSTTVTSTSNTTVHSSANSLPSTSNLNMSVAMGVGGVGGGRSSASYRLRTQSTSARTMTTKNLTSNLSSNYHDSSSSITTGPNHFGSVKHSSSSASTLTSSDSSHPHTASGPNNSNNNNNSNNTGSHNLIRQSLPVRAGP